MKRNLIFLFLLLPVCFIRAQDVVVSTYYNAADPRDEWIELLVITDNTDMRSWTIRDNNSSQTSWQTAVTFANVAFWNNMRAGTIIMLWNRPIQSDGVTAHPLDVNKNDGYVEVDATNSSYFTGGVFGTAPTWSGNSLNFAGGGDVIQLRNSSSVHVHALGHISTAGTDWTALPSPKLNHANTLSSGDAVYVCPGTSIAEYGTNTPQSGTTYTSKNNSTITFGLPNSCGASTTANAAFWNSTREPVFANQTVLPSSVVPGNPGSISFSWTAATDPNPADATTGYIILRNTVNTFTDPLDGTTYTAGNTIGSADVLAIINASGTTSYTDNTVMNGNSYFYRVYAFRYGTDNQNGNSYNASRGRAYTSTFVQVNYSTPLPVSLLSFQAERMENMVKLEWVTASETNNDYFTIERADAQNIFNPLLLVNGAGNSSHQLSYAAIDLSPLPAVNYYRLCQTDFNGDHRCYSPVAVNFESTDSNVLAIETVFTAEENMQVQISSSEAQLITWRLFDPAGRIVRQSQTESPGGIQTLLIDSGNLGHGVYLLEIAGKNKRAVARIIR